MVCTVLSSRQIRTTRGRLLLLLLLLLPVPARSGRSRERFPKSDISSEDVKEAPNLVEMVRKRGGRFLKERNGLYFDVGDEEATASYAPRY